MNIPSSLNTIISIHSHKHVTTFHAVGLGTTLQILYLKFTHYMTSKCVDHVKYGNNLCPTSHEKIAISRETARKIKWKTASTQRQIVNMHVIRHGNFIIQLNWLNWNGMNDVRHTYHKIPDSDYVTYPDEKYDPNSRPRNSTFQYFRLTKHEYCAAHDVAVPLLYKQYFIIPSDITRVAYKKKNKKIIHQRSHRIRVHAIS